MAAKKPQTPAPSSDIGRMMRLFQSNPRSSGRFDPDRERMFTESKPLTEEDFGTHLQGKMGIGGVPILDDDTCFWAAIDIDNHGSDEDIPILPLDERIRNHKLPLVPCRSKSGGVHAYLFLERSQAAAQVRTLMTGWATTLGYAGSEVFPKQTRLMSSKDGTRQLGNWINLPYLGNGTTMRYAVYGGRRLSLEQFLDHAEHLRLTPTALQGVKMGEHPDAPPCIQKMYALGVAPGFRNEALYNTVIYLKKVDPDGYQKKAEDANNSIFERPLARSEAARTIASAAKPDYSYRCNEEPIRSLCDRETCLKRKYGITAGDLERINSIEALPPFANLIKYVSEPPRWEVEVDAVKITNISTQTLLDWRYMRELIADRLTRIVPMIKNQEWERMLQDLMKTTRIVTTPDDASLAGVVRDRLREFANKTDLIGDHGKDKDSRKALLRGMPVIQVVEGERSVMFRPQDFINYLKRTKSEELKGVNLWFAVKDMGVGYSKVRAGDSNINVWHIPVKDVLRGQPTAPEYKSDL
jgi:hypothetical protein